YGALRVLLEEAQHVVDQLLVDVVLLEVGRVHEDEVLALAIEVLPLRLLDDRLLDLLLGVEGRLEDLSGADVLQLRADERRPLARLHELELDDVPELAVVLDRDAVLEVVARDRGHESPSRVRRTEGAPLRGRPPGVSRNAGGRTDRGELQFGELHRSERRPFAQLVAGEEERERTGLVARPQPPDVDAVDARGRARRRHHAAREVVLELDARSG